MNRCKTCAHWRPEEPYGGEAGGPICKPIDPDTMKPMQRGFRVGICQQPTQTFCESPVERDGFGLADGSNYMAILATAEDFGCVKWEAAIAASPRSLAAPSLRSR